MNNESWSVDAETILKFSGPGPRYTSYPTVPVWTEDVGPETARAAYERAGENSGEPLSLYVHIPFCKRRCLFCGCTVEITRREDRVERYLRALEAEINLVAELLGDRKHVTQLHLGGGTPTHLDSTQLAALVGHLEKHFVFQPDAELSLEVHPHVTSFEQIDTLVGLGFNRISMGVQDTDPHVQKVVHRDQTVEETVELVEHCRKRGIQGVNLDLMYGLPAQTEETFAATMDTVANIRPDRLAIYGYAHVPWLKKTQKALEKENLPGPVERAQLFFSLSLGRLSAVGYEVIGLDHFALRSDSLYESLEAGTLHRNFMGYTTQRAVDMAAFGMSAIGDISGTFLQNASDTASYEKKVESGELATVRGLVRSPEDELRRAAIQDLMCRMELDLDSLEERFDRNDLEQHFAPEWRALAPYEEEGFCRLSARKVTVRPRGRLFLRHLAMAFDAYLGDREPDQPRFSQTV